MKPKDLSVYSKKTIWGNKYCAIHLDQRGGCIPDRRAKRYSGSLWQSGHGAHGTDYDWSIFTMAVYFFDATLHNSGNKYIY